MHDVSDAPRHDPDSPAARLGPLIREARQGLSQAEFAELVDRPQSVISNLETGKQIPGLDLLAQLEHALSLPMGALAARAGYISRAVFPPDPAQAVFSKRFETLDQAAVAAHAGQALDLDVTVTSEPGDPRRWLVTVCTTVDDHDAL